MQLTLTDAVQPVEIRFSMTNTWGRTGGSNGSVQFGGSILTFLKFGGGSPSQGVQIIAQGSTPAVDVPLGTNYEIRIRNSASRVQVKAWNTEDSEPAAWSFDDTDVGNVLTPIQFNGVAGTTEVAYSVDNIEVTEGLDCGSSGGGWGTGPLGEWIPWYSEEPGQENEWSTDGSSGVATNNNADPLDQTRPYHRGLALPTPLPVDIEVEVDFARIHGGSPPKTLNIELYVESSLSPSATRSFGGIYFNDNSGSDTWQYDVRIPGQPRVFGTITAWTGLGPRPVRIRLRADAEGSHLKAWHPPDDEPESWTAEKLGAQSFTVAGVFFGWAFDTYFYSMKLNYFKIREPCR
jgi:hypothetical protein